MPKHTKALTALLFFLGFIGIDSAIFAVAQELLGQLFIWHVSTFVYVGVSVVSVSIAGGLTAYLNRGSKPRTQDQQIKKATPLRERLNINLQDLENPASTLPYLPPPPQGWKGAVEAGTQEEVLPYVTLDDGSIPVEPVGFIYTRTFKVIGSLFAIITGAIIWYFIVYVF